MKYKYKIFTQAEYEEFIKKAHLQPRWMESTGRDGEYVFKNTYIHDRKTLGYTRRIIGFYPANGSEGEYMYNVLERISEEDRKFFNDTIATPEGRELHKKTFGYYPGEEYEYYRELDRKRGDTY